MDNGNKTYEWSHIEQVRLVAGVLRQVHSKKPLPKALFGSRISQGKKWTETKRILITCTVELGKLKKGR